MLDFFVKCVFLDCLKKDATFVNLNARLFPRLCFTVVHVGVKLDKVWHVIRVQFC